jgi:hypothetical protein
VQKDFSKFSKKSWINVRLAGKNGPSKRKGSKRESKKETRNFGREIPGSNFASVGDAVIFSEFTRAELKCIHEKERIAAAIFIRSLSGRLNVLEKIVTIPSHLKKN